MNDKLLELKRKKLQQQILYLRTELEETEWIFQDCLKEFDDRADPLRGIARFFVERTF